MWGFDDATCVGSSVRNDVPPAEQSRCDSVPRTPSPRRIRRAQGCIQHFHTEDSRESNDDTLDRVLRPGAVRNARQKTATNRVHTQATSGNCVNAGTVRSKSLIAGRSHPEKTEQGARRRPDKRCHSLAVRSRYRYPAPPKVDDWRRTVRGSPAVVCAVCVIHLLLILSSVWPRTDGTHGVDQNTRDEVCNGVNENEADRNIAASRQPPVRPSDVNKCNPRIIVKRRIVYATARISLPIPYGFLTDLKRF